MAHHEVLSPFVPIAAFAFGTIVGTVISRYRTHLFQNRGEAKVSNALRRFPAPNYHLLNHVTLPLGNGSTQVDHVLVSRFGVFVIETKDHGGWIFGSADDRYWTKVFFGNRYRFQNPLRQNLGHLHAVQRVLDFLPADAIRSAVVFTGNAKFKTSVPVGVFTLQELVAFVERRTVEVMSINRVQFCVGRLETARLSMSKETDVAHVQRLRRRYGNED
jgi:hypothetical protein